MIWIALLALMHLFAAIVLTERFWKPTRLSDFPAFIALTALSTFYGMPVILGYTTTFINTWTILASAAITTALAIAASRRSPAGSVQLSLAWQRRPHLRNWPELLGWFSIALLLLLTLCVGSMLPIRIWDAAAYHSINPMRWAQSHRFRLDSFGDPTLYPYLGAGEVYANLKAVLPFLVLHWTGSLAGTALAQWPWFAAIPTFVLAIFRRAELPRWTVPLGSLFCMLGPEVLLQSVEAYSDVVFLAAQLAVLCACMLVWEDGPGRRALLIAALAFAQLAGSKPTGLSGAAALGAVFLVVVFWRAGGSVTARIQRTFAALGIVVLVCLAIAGPWYVHGLLKLHNPVYPIEVAAGEHVIFPGPYQPSFNTLYAERYAKASGALAWWRMMMDAWRPPSIASWSGNMGAHAAALGLPSLALFLLLGLRGPAAAQRRLLAVLFGVLVLSCPTLILARFVMFTLFIGAFAFCWLLSYTTPLPRRALAGLATVCLLYNFYQTFPSMIYRERPPELFAYNFLSGDARALRDDTFPDEYSTLDYWREHVATAGTTLAIPEQMAPWFAYAPRTQADVIRVADPKPGAPFETWWDALRASGATYLYAPRDSENFRVASAHPEHFRLLMHRVDSAAETRLWMEPKPEAALYQILPGRTP